MRKKHLTRLLLVAAALVTLTVLLSFAHSRRAEYVFSRGGYLLPGFNPDRVHGLYLKTPEGDITFRRKGECFVIADRNAYPASNEAMNRLFRQVIDIRTAEEVTSNGRNFGELGVAGDAEGTVIRLFNDKGQKMTGVVIGKPSRVAPGHYVRLEESLQVFISETAPADIRSRYMDYVDQQLVRGSAKDYLRVICQGPGGTAVVDLRDGEGPAAPAAAGRSGAEARQAFVRSAFGLAVRDVHSREDFKALPFRDRLQFFRNDKTIYQIEVAEQEGRYYGRAEADYYRPGGDMVVSRDETPDALKEKEKVLLARDSVMAFNEVHGGWVYELDPAGYRNLMDASEELKKHPAGSASPVGSPASRKKRK